jgi:peptide deformylase
MHHSIINHSHSSGAKILPIRIFPDPILRKSAHPIAEIDDSILQLARDMFLTLRNAHGIGLAANQVGVLKQLITLDVPGDMERVLINPNITARHGKRQVDEGCLSLPGYTGLITRAITVTANYLDQYGGRIKVTAEELLAQAIEHEIDHLNGIMYLDHLVAHEKLAKNGVAVDEPHWHDVGYDVYVSADKHTKSDDSLVELLHTTAEFSKLNADANPDDATYELSGSAKIEQGEIPDGVQTMDGINDDKNE